MVNKTAGANSYKAMKGSLRSTVNPSRLQQQAVLRQNIPVEETPCEYSQKEVESKVQNEDSTSKNINLLNSEKLLNEARAGSLQAFSTLVSLNQASVRAFLFRFVRCSASIDDLAQEVFLAAFRSIESATSAEHFRPWLFKIAKNRALNYLRTEARRQKRLGRWIESQDINGRVKALSDLEFERNNAEKTALRTCMEKLPEHSRSLIRQFYFEQRSASSLSHELGERSGTLRMRLKRIRAVLGRCIESSLLVFTCDQARASEEITDSEPISIDHAVTMNRADTRPQDALNSNSQNNNIRLVTDRVKGETTSD